MASPFTQNFHDRSHTKQIQVYYHSNCPTIFLL